MDIDNELIKQEIIKNTLFIRNYKSYSDKTLNGMSKEELIRIIRCLEWNWASSEEKCARQYRLLMEQ